MHVAFVARDFVTVQVTPKTGAAALSRPMLQEGTNIGPRSVLPCGAPPPPHLNGVRYAPYTNDLELLHALHTLTAASLLRYSLLRLLRTALLQIGVCRCIIWTHEYIQCACKHTPRHFRFKAF